MNAAATHLPIAKEVRDLLTDLLGKDVTLQPGPPFAVTASTPASIAVYVDDSLQIRAVITCDLKLSAYVAAALALMPLAGAEAVIELGIIDESMRENLYEILNIAASLFNVPDSPHVRLYDLHSAGVALPPDIRARTQTLGRREDLTVDIAGYGSGRLSIVLT